MFLLLLSFVYYRSLVNKYYYDTADNNMYFAHFTGEGITLCYNFDIVS